MDIYINENFKNLRNFKEIEKVIDCINNLKVHHIEVMDILAVVYSIIAIKFTEASKETFLDITKNIYESIESIINSENNEDDKN